MRGCRIQTNGFGWFTICKIFMFVRLIVMINKVLQLMNDGLIRLIDPRLGNFDLSLSKEPIPYLTPHFIKNILFVY